MPNDGGCYPRITCDQGTWIYGGWMKNSYLVLHDKTLCNHREGVFPEQEYKGEEDTGPVKYCPSSVQLTAKARRGGCDFTAHWALLRRYDRGVSTVQLCTLICAYGTWTPLLDAPHISERKSI